MPATAAMGTAFYWVLLIDCAENHIQYFYAMQASYDVTAAICRTGFIEQGVEK